MIDFILGGAWPYIAGAVALVVGWFAARQSGKKSEQQKQIKRRLDAVQKARKNEREAEGKTDAQIIVDISHN